MSSPSLGTLDSETQRVLALAVELTCIALRTGDCDEGVRRAIEAKIIDLAKSGERNPDILAEEVLQEIRGAAGMSHPSQRGVSRYCRRQLLANGPSQPRASPQHAPPRALTPPI
jgi:hypothetical protein